MALGSFGAVLLAAARPSYSAGPPDVQLYLRANVLLAELISDSAQGARAGAGSTSKIDGSAHG